MKHLKKVHHYLAALFLFAMALIAFINVLSRYIFHFPLAFTEEITINLFVLMTVLGTGIAFERSSQLGMVTLVRCFHLSVQKAVVYISAILSSVLFVTVDIAVIRYIYFDLTLFHERSPALNIPIWIYYIFIPLLSLFVFKGIYTDTRNRLKALTVSKEGT
jgi:TRAP-type C4-dicarboxylate transport system permease small subunit